jgi:DNA-directed RNA polymerase subunit RPC12/RpoP
MTSRAKCAICERRIGAGQFGVFCTRCGTAYDLAVSLRCQDQSTNVLIETVTWVARRVRAACKRKGTGKVSR